MADGALDLELVLDFELEWDPELELELAVEGHSVPILLLRESL